MRGASLAGEIQEFCLFFFFLLNIKLFPSTATAPVMTGPPQGQPLPPDYGPPPYEATPGFVPPHVPGEGPMPKPMHMHMPMPHSHGGCANQTHTLMHQQPITIH